MSYFPNISLQNISVVSSENASNTKYGFMGYLLGTTYNGVALSITSTSGTITSQAGTLMPYQMADESWRLRFNISVNFQAAVSRVLLFVPGVNFRLYKGATASPNIAIAASTIDSYQLVVNGFAQNNSGFISLSVWANGEPYQALSWQASGDLALELKPTWAY